MKITLFILEAWSCFLFWHNLAFFILCDRKKILLIPLENSIPSSCSPWKSCISILYYFFDFLPLPRKVIWFSCISQGKSFVIFHFPKNLLILYFSRKICACLVFLKENLCLSCISQGISVLVLYFSWKIIAYLVFLKENLYTFSFYNQPSCQGLRPQNGQKNKQLL